MSALWKAVAVQLPAGKVQLSTPISRVSYHPADRLFNVEAGGELPQTFQARQVIMTMPFSCLRSEHGILDDASIGISRDLRTVIDRMSYAQHGKLIVRGDAPNNLLYGVDHTHEATVWGNPRGLTFISHKPSIMRAAEASVVTRAQTHFGAVGQGRTDFKAWGDDPFSRGSYSIDFVGGLFDMDWHTPCGYVEHVNKLAFPLGIEGSLFFAGEHVNSGLGGYVESAVRSGEAVARYIAKRL
jgi:monoamine oxidase